MKRPLGIVLCVEGPYDLINVLGSFPVILKIFIKVNLPILVVMVGQRGKSQKCIDLSAFN